MKYWLIEIIHNLDLLCNIGFWFFAIIVLLIPSEATLYRLLI